jgi:hypothetical protein
VQVLPLAEELEGLRVNSLDSRNVVIGRISAIVFEVLDPKGGVRGW